MAKAHMPESVDHALMGEDTVGNGKRVAQVGEFVGHGVFPVGQDGGAASRISAMSPACTANMSSPVMTVQPRRRAASRSGVRAGLVMRSATYAEGSSRAASTGSGSVGCIPA